jgi:hypothetical protein
MATIGGAVVAATQGGQMSVNLDTAEAVLTHSAPRCIADLKVCQFLRVEMS